MKPPAGPSTLEPEVVPVPVPSDTLTPALFREALTPAELAFEERRRSIGLVLGPLLFVVLFLAPLPGLSVPAHRLAAILAATIVFWITEALPLPVTGLLGVALCVLTGVDTVRETLAPFADHLIFLMIGGFILAEAIFVHGLNRRFAFLVLSLPWVGARPGRVLVAYGGVTAVLSLWVSNTATTALMLPIGLSLLAFLYSRRPGSAPLPRREYATALMLTTSFAASLGGLGTPVGTPTNLIGMGFVKEQLGIQIGFFQWMALSLPIVVVLLAAMLWSLNRGASAGVAEISGGREFLRTERRLLGPLTPGERNVLFIFGATVLFWMFPGVLALFGGTAPGSPSRLVGERLPEGMVALLGAAALFVIPTSFRHLKPTITWPEASRIDWGTVLLLGTGMALGRLCERSGLARAMGEVLASSIPAGSLFFMLAISTLAAILISETTSNMAAVTMLVPLVIPISRGAGIDPLLPALGATMGGSLGFMLPVSTPPNAIVYGSGYVPISRMIRYGLLLDAMGLVVVVAVLYFLGPLVLRTG
jgi:sodium-dependent dicarboxylate transporter 2/3/5